MIEQFFRSLQDSGFLLSDESIEAYDEAVSLLDDQDIADVLWLASKISDSIFEEADIDEEATADPEPSLPTPDLGNENSIGVPPPPVSAHMPPAEKSQQESEAPTAQESDDLGMAIDVQAAPALPDTRLLGRAFRPIMRKMPSLTQTVLDEIATVNRIAEHDIWLPILKPTPERWFDLELVIESSPYSFIWQETLDEFQHLLETQGAFRNVRTWFIQEGSNHQPKLVAKKQTRSPHSNLPERRPKELVDPAGRRIVLFVSDCRSSLWKRGSLHDWFSLWSQHGPLAIVQLLPERLWGQSELDVGFQIQVESLIPGASNPKLVVRELPKRIAVKAKDALTLPIVTLTPNALKQWALVVSAAGRQRVPARLFDLSWVKDPEREGVDSIVYPTAPEARVEQFYATASPIAQRLARMMAVMPVDLSVVHLIQKELSTQGIHIQPVHISEVFSSGLVAEVTQQSSEESVRYDFADGVRQYLIESNPLDETLDILDLLSKRLARTLGIPSINSFMALLSPSFNWSPEDQAALLPFAQVAIEVLYRLGGEFKELAQQVEQDAQRYENWIEPFKQTEEVPDFPPLASFEFIDAQLVEKRPPFVGHTDSINSVAFSPDGKTIVSGSSDRTLRLWTLEGQPLDSPFVGHTDSVNSVAFSPDGETIVSGSSDRTLRLWTLDGQSIGSPFEGHTDSVNSVAFSPDGQIIASGSSDRTLILWSPDGGKYEPPFFRALEHTRKLNAVIFSPSGQQIVSCDDSTVNILELDGLSSFRKLPGNGANSVAYSPDRIHIAYGGSNRVVRYFQFIATEVTFDRTRTGDSPFDDQTMEGHTDSINAIAFTPDGQTIVSASRDNTLKLWNLEGEIIANLADHSGYTNTIAISPDGQYIISAGNAQTLRLINISDILPDQDFPPPLQTETYKVTTLEPPPPETTQQLQPFPITIATLTQQKDQWQLQTQQSTAHRYIETLPTDLPLEMIAIPSGTFLMGSHDDDPQGYSDETPQHEVSISPFFLGRYPITQAQWRAVAQMPQINQELDPDPAEFKGDTHPVEQVSWHDAMEFCARLSAHTGRDYHLPTEAQWEYACRAGTTTPFHFGDMITTDLANYDGSSYADGPSGEDRRQTTPVDHFGYANAFGLSDMHGNVYEWCQDHWHENYEGAPIDGTAWVTDEEETGRIRRGGSWINYPWYCRSAYRHLNDPGNRLNIIGFRVSCSSPRALQ